MACQSMLIVLVGATPEYRMEQQDDLRSSQQERPPHITFAGDMDSIVTEVLEL